MIISLFALLVSTIGYWTAVLAMDSPFTLYGNLAIWVFSLYCVMSDLSRVR